MKQGKNPAFLREHISPQHRILPFFIPMEGCPNACIYCDQKQISQAAASPSHAEIEAAVAALREPAELAFYGGSFTMLPRELQAAYLAAAQPGLREGKISSIRVSTRPDGISAEGLELLKGYGVKTIELGVQSMEERVLHRAGRFYDAETVQKAVGLIKQYDMLPGIQLMPGLPLADHESDLKSALAALELQPACVRIYPTIVIRNTELEQMRQEGSYEPLSLEDAIARCRDMAAFFLLNDIPVIRMGLNNTPGFAQSVTAGPFADAFGALTYSALALEHMRLFQEQTHCDGISADRSYLPLLFGQNACNKPWITANLPDGLHGNRHMPRHMLAYNEATMSEKEFLAAYCTKILSSLSPK